MGLSSSPRSRSMSPCRKNSSIKRPNHFLYNSSDFVGLLRSEQCTMFCNTCKKMKSDLNFFILFAKLLDQSVSKSRESEIRNNM